LFNFKPKWVESWASLYKEKGLKIFLKEKGWKAVLVFFLFYLVRDTFLYIIIPWLGYSHFSSCF